jgi:hypothetical protein
MSPALNATAQRPETDFSKCMPFRDDDIAASKLKIRTCSSTFCVAEDSQAAATADYNSQREKVRAQIQSILKALEEMNQ